MRMLRYIFANLHKLYIIYIINKRIMYIFANNIHITVAYHYIPTIVIDSMIVINVDITKARIF